MLIATAIAIIAIIIVAALTITCYLGGESITFPVKGNINPPYNQAEIVLQYPGDWIGDYSFVNQAGQRYFTQELNGTGNMHLIVDRPNDTAPWILKVMVQGSRVHGNLTLSIFLVNGTIIDTITRDSFTPGIHILSVTVNMANLTSSHSANDGLP